MTAPGIPYIHADRSVFRRFVICSSRVRHNLTNLILGLDKARLRSDATPNRASWSALCRNEAQQYFISNNEFLPRRSWMQGPLATVAVGVASAGSVAQTACPCTVRAGLSVRLATHLLCQTHLAVDDEPQVSAAPAQLLDQHAAFRGHVFLLGGGRRLQDRYRLRRVVHRLVQTASGNFSRRF